VETTVTKNGQDHLKRRARALARTTGRRYPDVLAELRGAPRSKPGAALVLVCSGWVHPIDGGRCARPAEHLNRDGGWGGCSHDPHYPVDIWNGYFEAEAEARRAEHDAWLASLTPKERAQYEEESEAEYRAQMAAEAAEPYDDPHRFVDPSEVEPASEESGYGPDDEYYDAEADEYDDWDGDRW
jgi:hypothetical protein